MNDSPPSPNALPRIDLSGLSSGSGPDKAKIVAQLGDSCRRVGFAQLANHGIPTGEISDLLERAREFFQLPDVEKSGYATRAHNRANANRYRGYFPTSDGGAFKEGFEIGPTHTKPHRESASFLDEPNVWPEASLLPDGWAVCLTEYFAAIERLGLSLLRCFAEYLGLPDDTFAAHFIDGNSTLRLIHYPPHPRVCDPNGDQPPRMGTPEHTDSGCLTLLAQDETGGLQVRTADGAWFDVPPVDGVIVMNLGDLLARWTNHVFVATPHRVLPATRSRYSAPFFLEPRADTEICCLETCVSHDAPALYPPIRYLDYLSEKLRGYQEYKDLVPDR